MMIWFLIGLHVFAAEAPPQFKEAKAKTVYPLDCHFANDQFKGRFRMDSKGAAQLALAQVAVGSTVHECKAVIERIEQNTVKIRPTTSLFLVRRMECDPQLPSGLFNLINLEPELVLTWRTIDFEIRNRDTANRCHILSYDRRQVGRVLQDLAGPTKKLEWPASDPKASR